MKKSIRLLFPTFKKKAIIFSYDDGCEDDIRLVNLFNQYDIKGNFNLNSKLMEEEFVWYHETGYKVKRLSLEEAKYLYNGHEIASHSLTHPQMEYMSDEEIFYEINEDVKRLEKFFNRKIYGYVTPFEYFSERVVNCCKNIGLSYITNSFESHDFHYTSDPYHFSGTIFHLSPIFDETVNNFFNYDEELAWMGIIGHSYDLSVNNMWDKIENICKHVKSSDDILSMTTHEFILYIEAVKKLIIEDDFIFNSSDIDIFLSINGENFLLQKGSKLVF